MIGDGDGDGVLAGHRGDLRGVGHLAHADGFGEHGVAEAVHRVGELRGDAGIDERINTGKACNVGAQLAHELVEHQMLVGHLVEQLGLLEQLLAGDLGGDVGQRIGPGPATDGLLAGEAVLGLQQVDHAVVLVDEHFLHGGQADVLVEAAVACHVVGLERRLVVHDTEAGDSHPVNEVTAIPAGGAKRRKAHAHVVEEGVLRRHQREVGGDPVRCRIIDERLNPRVVREGRVLDIDDFARDLVERNQLRHAVGIQDRLAEFVEGHQGNARDVGVMQRDADLQRVGLDLGPVGDAGGVDDAVDADTGIDQAAGGEIDYAGFKGCVARRRAPSLLGQVLAQEDCAAHVRAIGLAQVDEGRGLVEALGAGRSEGEGERAGLAHAGNGREGDR